jgi:hypothetical protein
MQGINAGVDDRDRGSAPVVPARPCLVPLDERNALREHRPDDRIVHHPDDVLGRVGIINGGLEVGRAHLQREVGHRLVSMKDARTAWLQPREDPRVGVGNRLALRADRRGTGRAPFRDVGSRRQIQFEDHAHAAVAHRALQEVAGRLPGGRCLRTSTRRGAGQRGQRADDQARGERRGPLTGHRDLSPSCEAPVFWGAVGVRPVRGIGLRSHHAKGAVKHFCADYEF